MSAHNQQASPAPIRDVKLNEPRRRARATPRSSAPTFLGRWVTRGTMWLAWSAQMILLAFAGDRAHAAAYELIHAWPPDVVPYVELRSCESINNDAQGVGIGWVGEGSHHEGLMLFWSEGSGPFGYWHGPAEFLYALNDHNRQVGETAGYVFINSAGFDPAPRGAALDINESDVAVGYIVDENVEPPIERAAAWIPTGDPSVDPWQQVLLGGSQYDSRATAINDEGMIVGWAVDSGGIPPHAVRWTLDGTITELDSVDRPSWANDVNNAGRVVGAYQPASGEDSSIAFVWDPSQPGLQSLPDLGGGEGEAVAINSAGWIIGRSKNADGYWLSFVLEPGGFPEKLSSSADVVARDINDLGEIVGDRAYHVGSPDARYGLLWRPGAPCTVDAGPNRVVGLGLEVTLEGTSDSAGTYTWEQIPAPGRSTIDTPVVMEVLPSAGNVTRMVFTAPNHETTLQFRLTVYSGNDFASDTVLVSVLNTGTGPIHVSANQGQDENVGTSDSPVMTLARALALANGKPGYPEPSPVMLVESGVYSNSATIELDRPVRMFGGFQYDGVDTWTRDATDPTEIHGPATAIMVDAPLPHGAAVEEGLTQVVIDGFAIHSADGADATGSGAAGESSVCIDVVQGSLAARNNNFFPGAGGDGGDGSTGVEGADGGRGEDALPASTKLVRSGWGVFEPEKYDGDIFMSRSHGPFDVLAPGGWNAFTFGTPGAGGRFADGTPHGGRGGKGGGFDRLAEYADTAPRKDIRPGLSGCEGQPGAGQEQYMGLPGVGTYDERTDWCDQSTGGVLPVPIPLWATTVQMVGFLATPFPAAGGKAAAATGSAGDGGRPGLPGKAGEQGRAGMGGSGGAGGGSYYRVDFKKSGTGIALWSLCSYTAVGVPGGCGGGGGAGGEGGHGGGSGGGGGLSSGILERDTALASQVADNVFFLNDGGRGGVGGTGGPGGSGGNGGKGGRPNGGFTSWRMPGDCIASTHTLENPDYFWYRFGLGAPGQGGQQGGNGGAGGGGGGGNSYGVYIDKLSFPGAGEVHNAFIDTSTAGGAGGEGGAGYNDGESGEQKNWATRGVPDTSGNDWMEWLDWIEKLQTIIHQIPYDPSLAVATVRTEWGLGDIQSRLKTPSGQVLVPDVVTVASGLMIQEYRFYEHPEYGYLGTELTVEIERVDSLSETDVPVYTAVSTVHNQWPVVQVRNLTLVAGTDGMANGSIDAGSYDPDPNDEIVLRQIPPGPYPVGTTTVTLEVEDPFSFVSSRQATVTVRDETPPQLLGPALIQVRADADGWGHVIIPVAAVDNADPDPSIEIDQLETYPVGTTQVPVRVTDASGNVSEKVVKILVVAEPTPSRVGVDGYVFEEGSIAPFIPVLGTWTLAGGQLVQTNPTDWALAMLDIGEFQQYSVTLYCTRTAGDFISVCYAQSFQGMDYRVDLGADYCRLTMPGEGESWETRTFMAQGPDLKLYPVGESNLLMVAVSTQGVQVFLNDEPVHDQPWLDGIPLGDGKVGLGTYNATAAFDNVLVTTLETLSPEARLTFDDGTAHDYSGHGNDGVLCNGASIVDDPVRGKVLELDGVDDYVDLGTDASLDLSDDGEATIAAWVKTDGSKVHHSVVTKGGWNDAYSLLINGDEEDRLWTGNDTSVFSGNSIPTGTWTHIAVVILGDLTTFYVNGLLSGAEYQDRGGPIDNHPADHLEIGREDASDDGSLAQWYFAGRLDDVRVYPMALTESEVQSVMGAQPPTLAVSEAHLTPLCSVGEDPPNDTFEMWNFGWGSLDYTVNEAISWLSCSPVSGPITGESAVITVEYDTTGLAAGRYTGTVAVVAEHAAGSPHEVAVTLTVSATPSVVLNTNDVGPGSLRGIIAGSSAGSVITFDESLSGQTILLTNGEIPVTRSLTLDASSLAGGLTLDGNDAGRILNIAGSTAIAVSLDSLTFTRGSVVDDDGGALFIDADATVHIQRCTFHDNHADIGTSGDGGAIANWGDVTVDHSTFSGNSAAGSAGAISVMGGTTVLRNATLSENFAGNRGGAIAHDGGTLLMTNTIVAGNSTLSADPNISGAIDSNVSNLTSGDPLLAPLGIYGGPTQTMPPLPGSPAIDAGMNTGSAPDTDQRGMPRVFGPSADIGAVEFLGAYDATLAVSPTTLSPTCPSGDDAPRGSFEVWNSGAAAARYAVSVPTSWISCLPGVGTTTREGNVISVHYDTDGLAPGIYTSTVTVAAQGLSDPPKTVEVTLTVTIPTTVVLNTADSGPGSLREAIAITEDGGVITFTDTLSGQTLGLTSGELYVDKDLTVDASSLPEHVVIDGNASWRLFDFANETTNILRGLTLTNGRASDHGGAVRVNLQAGLTIADCSILGNSAHSYGGAIYIEDYGEVTIENSTLSGNSAGHSGGAIHSQFAVLTINGSTLSDNSAGLHGGAIECYGGTLMLSNATLKGNSALWGIGGGIYNASSLTINHSELSGNSAYSDGGGIYNASSLTINHSELSGNSAHGDGGGICNDTFWEATLSDSSLYGNSAGDHGGGIYNDADGEVTLTNSTLCDNSALYGGGILNFAYGGLTVNSCTIFGNSGGIGGGIHNVLDYFQSQVFNSIVAGNTPENIFNVRYAYSLVENHVEPMLAPLGDYGGPTPTMPPIPGSPAINAGHNSMPNLPATDQRGFSRPFGGAVDIGAVEFQGAEDVARFWSTDWDGDGSSFGIELALGTDPLVADPDTAGRIAPYPPSRGTGASFGFNSFASNYTAWVLNRSLDLILDPFVEVYRFDGPTGEAITSGVPVTVNVSDNIMQVTDDTFPQPPAAFYQLQIEQSP